MLEVSLDLHFIPSFSLGWNSKKIKNVEYDICLPEASDLIGKKIPESYLDLLEPGFLVNCDGS